MGLGLVYVGSCNPVFSKFGSLLAHQHYLEDLKIQIIVRPNESNSGVETHGWL
jgi:hypothetical protein